MELNLIPWTKSSALDAWSYNAETGELSLRWRNSIDIYVYTGNVANFEADVREYRSWGRVANWYANSRTDITLKEVISQSGSYIFHTNLITGEYKTVRV